MYQLVYSVLKMAALHIARVSGKGNGVKSTEPRQKVSIASPIQTVDPWIIDSSFPSNKNICFRGSICSPS